jgi:S-adenosylmethionine:tRNA ribosyltransferase-isomerase
MTRRGVAPGAVGQGGLRLQDLDYELPDERVAQHPVDPRDASRLLVYRRDADRIDDRVFSDLPGLLRPGDVLVRNDTRVFPARAFFRRATGGRIEALFLRPAEEEPAGGGAPAEAWEVLLRGRPRAGETLLSESLGDEWPLLCEERLGDGRWRVASRGDRPVLGLLDVAGVTPLPPYIRETPDDPERYQTTYARVAGSAAAPTAGLHFTPALDAALAAAGVTVETVTLHVGLGTFKPLQDDTLAAGRLHSEAYEVDAAAWARLGVARAQGRRVVAVGTTSLRTLEHLGRATGAGHGGGEAPAPGSAASAPDATTSPDDGGGEARASQATAPVILRGDTTLLITPGFEFAVVDALITNFHLPRTSLLALVMAFCGVEQTRRLYRHAVVEEYRFYSFGDAMLAL